jgi:hypothetical protein
MFEDSIPVRPPTLVPGLAGQGGYVDFIDQVPEERRLRQELGVEERRLGLEQDGEQLLESMESARRVNIVQRHGEDQSPDQFRQPARAATARRLGAPADDVVACVDGLKQWIQMICAPRLHRGCNQHQWHVGIFETTAKGFRQTKIRDRDDSMLDWPSHFGNSLRQRGDDGFGLLVR